MPSSEQNGLDQAYQEFALVYDGRCGNWITRLGLSMSFLYQKYTAFPERAPARSLLDLACGTGSFMALMMERGWKVTGVDRVIFNARHCRG